MLGMITFTTSITILRRERTFSRFKQSKLTYFQKRLPYRKINFFLQNPYWRLHLKKTQLKLRKLRNYFLAWIETLDER